MNNELVLILSLAGMYLGALLFYKLMGRTGLYMWTVVATIAANIEALILVDAFGMEMTLGNTLFASTFLVTDILSETEGRKYAGKAVRIGILVSIAFILITQSWFLYTPNGNDWVSPAIKAVFSNTPRLMLVGVAVYGIVQVFDVWMYHLIWKRTEKWLGNSHKGLWIRNNGSTLLSQLLNTFLFTFGAFYGIYEIPTLLNICLSSYVIFIVTSLADTPAVYAARWMKEKGKIAED
ncbi:putative integral membrane protein (TIGR00697 family) [Clostridiales Family XIII bacterium PM5-7]